MPSRPRSALLCLSLAACGGRPGGDEAISENPQGRLALERFARQDHAGGEAALAAVVDPFVRDLVRAHAARELGVDTCHLVQDPEVRRQCAGHLRRPHLRRNATGDAPEGRAVGPGPVPPDSGCGQLAQPLRDDCLLEEAMTIGPGPGAMARCAAMTSTDAYGRCLGHTAALSARRGEEAEAVQICGAMDPGRWRDECFFRAAEAVRDAAPEDRIRLCREAGAFADECTMHVASHAAAWSVVRQDGSHAEAQLRLQEAWAQVSAAVDPALLAPEAAYREFWSRAYYQLGIRAPSASAVLAWPPGVVLLPDDAPRQRAWEDMRVVAWTRLHVRELGDEVPDLGLEGWRGALGRARSDVVPGDPGDLVPAGQRGAGQVPAGGVPPAGERVVLGRLPFALDPANPCPPPPEDRLRVALILGLGPLPWDRSRRLLEEGLAHADLLVRWATADLVVEKATVWLLAPEGPPAWVVALLRERAVTEPHADLARQFTALAQALEQGETPHRVRLETEGICGGLLP